MMSPLRLIFHFGKTIIVHNRNVFNGKMHWLSCFQLQAYQYTKKSAEEKLGIEKPKRPLNPFLKFVMQMRPALNNKVPGISSKEAIVWSSKHWQQLDNETKLQMKKVYENDIEVYKKKMILFKSSLTEEQKEDIKRMNLDMIATKKKRKLKAEIKKMGKPKKPMSSYLLYTQTRKDMFPSIQLKEYQEKVKVDWLMLSQTERDNFEKQAQFLMDKYKKDLEAWELKMISMGLTHLVHQKVPRSKKAKTVEAR